MLDLRGAAVAGISITDECCCAWNGRFPFADLSASIKNQSALVMRHSAFARTAVLWAERAERRPVFRRTLACRMSV
jgi:hypothetical protein